MTTVRAARSDQQQGAWTPAALRGAFPMLSRRVRGRRLAYLDNAATALKPRAVTEAMARYYSEFSANVARGVHTASQEATEEFEAARARVAAWLGADPDEIVFTAGTTAGLNLVAQSFGGPRLAPGDEILVTEMEHHSNLVPWQLIAERTGAVIRAIGVDDQGELDLSRLDTLVSERTRIVAVCHVSNVLGTVVPVRTLADRAHAVGAVCVVDGAQGAPHLPVDVSGLGADFYVFSGHKMFGPTGIGVLYGRRGWLESMPPWQGGGGMIASVEIGRSTYAPPPARFEAGTPPIAEAIGLAAAIDYVESWDRTAALAWEDELVRRATERLLAIPGTTVFGRSPTKVGVISFTVEGIHPHDVGTALDAEGVAVRAGHHCAQPLMKRFGVAATVRASFAPYNTDEDVDALVAGVERARELFGA
jgi:cysteine desulfurase / selenocysteine lyase